MIIVWLMHMHQRMTKRKGNSCQYCYVRNKRLVLINMIICWKTVKLSKKEVFLICYFHAMGNIDILYQMRGSQKLKVCKFLIKGEGLVIDVGMEIIKQS
jgi:hypothetical protein